jgi:hypothetical protein
MNNLLSCSLLSHIGAIKAKMGVSQIRGELIQTPGTDAVVVRRVTVRSPAPVPGAFCPQLERRPAKMFAVTWP